MTSEKQPDASFSQLKRFPYFLTYIYEQLGEVQSPVEGLELVVKLFELSVRLLVLILVSQYLSHDREDFQDWDLDRLLAEELFTRATFTVWYEILLTLMSVYRDKRERLFVPEIYDLFWKRQGDDIVPSDNPRELFENLKRLRNDMRSVNAQWNNNAEISHLYNHATHQIEQLLNHLQFFTEYDIIHLLWIRDNKYRYEVFSGPTIKRETRTLPSGQTLSPAHAYLRHRKNRTFLDLYPLALTWLLEEMKLENPTFDKEIGLYKSYRYQRVTYLLPMQGGDSQASFPANDLENLIQTVRVLKSSGEPPPLNWRLLCRNLRKISEAEMDEKADGDEVNRGKYRTELYLQRMEAYRSYEAFLQSDQRILMITGKSGVGKSSFLLALQHQYAHDEDGSVCFVVYNGSNLRSEESLETRLAQDLGHVLAAQPYNNLLQRIGEIPGIANRRLVLAVDAINEHPEPASIMGQLNDLAHSEHSWLKIVITSRPQAWRTIQRMLSGELNEIVYYRQPGNYRLGIQLNAFSGKELAAVYAKYQTAFQLDKDYNALSPRMKQIMRDPLMLRLLAQTFSQALLPTDVRISDIYESYVDGLIQSKRLTNEDLSFLQETLVPLLWDGEYISNSISAEVIDRVSVGIYSDLFDLIFDKGIGASGQRVNQNFQNLVDTEILVKRGRGQNYRIEFSYERFYEYFVGKRLHNTFGKQTPYRGYIKLIEQIAERPYLWGAIRTTILLSNDPSTLLLNLAEEKDPIIRDMVVDSFIELGKETVKGSGEGQSGYERVLQAVRQLLDVRTLNEENNILWQVVGPVIRLTRRFLGWRYVDMVHAVHLKDIALEVAYGLSDSLSDRSAIILFHLDAFAQPLWQTRRKATRNLYGIWYAYPNERPQIMSQLNDRLGITQLIRGGVFIQSTIGFLLRILFTHYEDKETVIQILKFAKNLINRIPQGIVEAGSSFILSLVASLVPGTALDSASQILSHGQTKQEFLILARFLDPANRLGEAEYTLIRRYLDEPTEPIDQSLQFIRQFFAKNTLLMQATRHFPEIKSFIETYFDEATSTSTRAWLISALTFTHPSTHRYAPPDEIYQTVDRMTRSFLRTYPGIWPLRDNPFLFVSRHWCSRHDVAIPIICEELASAQANANWPYLNRIIIDIAQIGHLYPLQALKTLDTLQNWEGKEIREAMIKTLAEIRFVEPDLCDVHLEQRAISVMMWDAIHRSRGNPEMLEKADTVEINQFALELVTMSDAIRSWLISLISSAANYNSLRPFAGHLVSELFATIRTLEIE